MDTSGYVLLIAVVIVVVITCCCCWCDYADIPDQPPTESPEQRLARTLALPYFPYVAHGGGASETVECSICLEPLRQWQLCSEVPVCRHVFHRECLGEWVRSNGSCPLCRAKIVPGSDIVAAADDMV